jgi:hypothetical protein
MPAVEHRLGKANAKFMVHKELLTNKAISRNSRFEKYSSLVVKSALYGSGCWIWSAALYDRLRRWESAPLRWMARLGRRKEEPFVDFIKRTTRRARELHHKAGFTSITTLALESIHRVAGHARFANSTLGSMIFLPQAMQWKDAIWLEGMKTIGSQEPHETWRHAEGYKKRAQREDVLASAFGVDWKCACSKNL